MSITGVKIENLFAFFVFNIISGHYFGVPSSIKVHLAVVPPISSTIKFFFVDCVSKDYSPSIPLAGPDSISVIGFAYIIYGCYTTIRLHDI
jgi:hypothetical protein